jgi:hypothetical protein
MESESVGSSDVEVTFSLHRFPAVNVKSLLRPRSYPVTSRYQQEEVERQRHQYQYEDEQTENDDDKNDFLQYCWDGDGDQGYFDDCGLEFVPPGDDSIDNIDLTSESAEEALFIATYKHGQTLNCVNVNRKSSLHMKRMKKLGATQMFLESNFTIAHYFILLFEHRVRYNSGDNEIQLITPQFCCSF